MLEIFQPGCSSNTLMGSGKSRESVDETRRVCSKWEVLVSYDALYNFNCSQVNTYLRSTVQCSALIKIRQG